MLADCFGGPIQGGHGIVRQQKPDARIVMRSPLTIECAKSVEPGRSPLSCTDADFECENLFRKLLLFLKIVRQLPEIGDGVANRVRMIRIGSSARQRFLKPMAGGAFPQRQVLPEEIIQTPDD